MILTSGAFPICCDSTIMFMSVSGLLLSCMKQADNIAIINHHQWWKVRRIPYKHISMSPYFLANWEQWCVLNPSLSSIKYAMTSCSIVLVYRIVGATIFYNSLTIIQKYEIQTKHSNLDQCVPTTWHKHKTQEVTHDWSNNDFHLLAYCAPQESLVHLRGSQMQSYYAGFVLSETFSVTVWAHIITKGTKHNKNSYTWSLHQLLHISASPILKCLRFTPTITSYNSACKGFYTSNFSGIFSFNRLFTLIFLSLSLPHFQTVPLGTLLTLF